MNSFLNFLGEGDSWDAAEGLGFLKNRGCDCSCPVHASNQKFPSKKDTKSAELIHGNNPSATKKSDEMREKTINMIRRAAALLQIFAVSQFGCGTSAIRLNSLKKSMKVNHWG